jgi:hypothetical protein
MKFESEESCTLPMVVVPSVDVAPPGVGVGVALGVSVEVGVNIEVGVGVGVGVFVGVAVGVPGEPKVPVTYME